MDIPKPKQTKKTQTNQIKKKSIKKKSTKKIKIIDNEIIKFMNENKNERNPYIRASKEINKGFTSKQIRQRWISKLDPLLCHEKLCEDEELYIIEWVEKYRNEHPFNDIKWKQLIKDLKIKSGKMRSENMVKNHYYLKGRQEKRRGQLPSKDDDASSSPQDSNSPKSVPSSPKVSNVSTTVSPSSKDNNVPKSVPSSPQDNNVSKIVLSYSQDDNASKSAPIYPQVNDVLKSVPTSPQDNNVSTTVSPSPQDNNVLKSVSFILYNNNVQERQVSDMLKIRNLLN
ncbi:hypothetical protein RhiirC2_851740 [Rhizophagus irregularis]|uniref:HTH myb-type domain-containing protein n=1 Tax=Rhizophagus irregularis TaxID=588596 RepID=A0A2N1N2A0_9GLOM|nr:hypothetical protein RhiirC2_851740 [Rhizophagus irregularis]